MQHQFTQILSSMFPNFLPLPYRTPATQAKFERSLSPRPVQISFWVGLNIFHYLCSAHLKAALTQGK